MSKHIPWGIVIMSALWFALSLTKLVDPLFLPSPVAVMKEFYIGLTSGVLLKHVVSWFSVKWRNQPFELDSRGCSR